MNRSITLSAGEWRIMERLWERSPRTLTELVRELGPETGWSKSTIVTMVGRLEGKGALTYTEGGRARQYAPPSHGSRRPWRRPNPCCAGCTGAAWG